MSVLGSVVEALGGLLLSVLGAFFIICSFDAMETYHPKYRVSDFLFNYLLAFALAATGVVVLVVGIKVIFYAVGAES